MATASINFAEDLGPSPKIIHSHSKGDLNLVSHSNLFYDSAVNRSGESSKAPITDRLTQALLSHRDADHGAWTFRENTERDLLAHVENGLSMSRNNAGASSAAGEMDEAGAAAAAILRSIDVYCLGKQWMYHVGAEKGEVIGPFLQKCIESRGGGGGGTSEPFVAVELGTYCGYSAVLLAMTARRCAPGLNFHLYSTEINPEYLEVAEKIIRMAELEEYVTLIHFDPAREKLAEALKKRIGADSSRAVDFLFLDHAKDSYLSDLRELERAGLIGRGSHVAADNVIASKKQLGEYREYVAGLAERGIAETSMVEGKLEYTENLKDGIEFTIYLQDPPK